MIKSGTKTKMPQCEFSSHKSNQSKASAVKNNRKIDDFFSFSNTKSATSSFISSEVKTLTSNFGTPNEENIPPTYLNRKKEREQLQPKQTPEIIIPIKVTKRKEKKNKEICSICLDGGELLLCDKCPNSFHITCLKISEDDLPKGNWYCNDCLLGKEKQHKTKKDKTRDSKSIKNKNINSNNRQKDLIKHNDTSTDKAGLSSSIMDSFFSKNHNENINMMNNINRMNKELSSTPISRSKSKSDKYDSNCNNNDLVPAKVLSSFSKEEQIHLSKCFLSHKDTKVFQFDQDNKHESNDQPKNANKNLIDDKDSYSEPSMSMNSLPSNCLMKPEGTLITFIAPQDIIPLLKIWDFIQSFSFLTSIAPFPLEYLHSALKYCANTKIEIPLINEVYSFFIYILVKEVQETDLTILQPESEMMMIKIICDNNNIKEFIKHSWPEVIKLFVQNDSEPLFNKLPLYSRDILSFITHLQYEDHICLLNYLLNRAVETDFLRSIIKEEQEKRDELKRNKGAYEEELKIKQSRKKELERQEKYTQPLMKINALKKRLETLSEDNPDLTRKDFASLRKSIEHQIEEFKSVIKESEIIKEEEIDILNQIERMNNEILNIGVIDKKCIGTDALGNKYYKFPWVNDKIYIKQRKQLARWSYLSSTEEVDELIQTLSGKGIRESNLKKKLLRIYPKHLDLKSNKAEEMDSYMIYKKALQWDNKKALRKNKVVQDDIEMEIKEESDNDNDDNEDDEIIDINNNNKIITTDNKHKRQTRYENSIYDEVIRKMNVIEELMTEYLSFEGKQWESFDTRCNIKSWLNCIKNLDEYKKTIALWTNKSKYPYHTNIINSIQEKRIDEAEDCNDHYSLIDSNGSLSYATINPSLQLSYKGKFWLKEYEQLGLESIFNDYLSQVASFPGLFFALFFFESLYNELTKQREFLKKKSEAIKASTSDFINAYAYKSTEIEIIDEGNAGGINEVKSRLRKRLHIRKKPQQFIQKNKRKDIDWDETCMVCGEFGDLICCEECSNVTHLYCAEMKKVPDIWLCEVCVIKMKNKRITRSRGHYFK